MADVILTKSGAGGTDLYQWTHAAFASAQGQEAHGYLLQGGELLAVSL